jgi:hypothetical protein
VVTLVSWDQRFFDPHAKDGREIATSLRVWHRPEPIGPAKGRTRWADPRGRNARLFSWFLDCFAPLAMTGRGQRKPLPVIARRSCAEAIQSSCVTCTEEAAFDQCLRHLFLFSEAKQSRPQARLDRFASLAMTNSGVVQRCRLTPRDAAPAIAAARQVPRARRRIRPCPSILAPCGRRSGTGCGNPCRPRGWRCPRP